MGKNKEGDMRKLIPLVLIVMLFSCSKNGDYIQKPTCYRYLELSDKYDGELIYIRTDTIFPNGIYNNVVCNEDTLKLINFKGKMEGCGSGWQQIRYLLIK